jgi:hypothetical protein
MSTAADLARARHEQALADLARAEAALAAAVDAAGIRVRPPRARVSADPDAVVFTVPWSFADVVDSRAVEAAVEADQYGPLGKLYSRYRRCQNAERKANRALLLARTAPTAEPAPKPKRRASKRRVGFCSYVRTKWDEEREGLAA